MTRLHGLAFVAALAACGPSKQAEERDRIAHAIDAVRDAPSSVDVDGGLVPAVLAERRRLLDALERERATSEVAVRARDACAKAHRLLLEGEELRVAVQAELADGADPSASMYTRLLEAEGRINQSAAAMPDCARASAELRLVR